MNNTLISRASIRCRTSAPYGIITPNWSYIMSSGAREYASLAITSATSTPVNYYFWEKIYLICGGAINGTLKVIQTLLPKRSSCSSLGASWETTSSTKWKQAQYTRFMNVRNMAW